MKNKDFPIAELSKVLPWFIAVVFGLIIIAIILVA